MLADLYLVITALSFPSVLFLFFFQSSAMLTLFLYACKITTRTYQSIEQLNRAFGTIDTDLTAESDNDAMCVYLWVKLELTNYTIALTELHLKILFP